MRPKSIPQAEHGIDRSHIDSDAIYVISTLQSAGHTAYLVGGSVRDLLIGRTPKDFDISTSARPEEIKKIFGKRCLLIGRRFRLAHVRFHHKIIEVATFRAGDPEHAELIVRDNQFGSPEEDVQRRDFTINGLFYEPLSGTVIDYVGGIDDIRAQLLRSIGDPQLRFQQDPVRMIRLLKFMARLQFDVEEVTLNGLHRCCAEIVKSSPTRILEEIFRMLESGAATPFFRLMSKSGMLEILFPCLDPFLKSKQGAATYNLLTALDQEHLKLPNRTLSRPLLFSCLMYPIVDRELHKQYLEKGLQPKMGDIIALVNSIVRGVVITSFSHFPKRISASMEYILAMQYRLTGAKHNRFYRPRFLQHMEFPWSLDLLQLRAQSQPSLLNTYQHWKQLYQRAASSFSKKAPREHGEDEEPPL